MVPSSSALAAMMTHADAKANAGLRDRANRPPLPLLQERGARAYIGPKRIHEGTLPWRNLSEFPFPVTIGSMSAGKFVLMAWVLAAAAFCSDQPSNLPILPCPEGAPGAVSCNPSKKELKEASEAFNKGLRLQKAKLLDQAFDHSTRLRASLRKTSNT